MCIICTKQWIPHGEKKVYIFNKYVKNATLNDIANHGIKKVISWKWKRIKYLFEWYYNSKHPLIISYILEKNVICFSEKDMKILREYSEKNKLGWSY